MEIKKGPQITEKCLILTYQFERPVVCGGATCKLSLDKKSGRKCVVCRFATKPTHDYQEEYIHLIRLDIRLHITLKCQDQTQVSVKYDWCSSSLFSSLLIPHLFYLSEPNPLNNKQVPLHISKKQLKAF